jgi:aspartate/methionine/tyrosine aminotransferase
VGLANALDLPETEEAVCKMVDAFAKRREVLIEGLDQIPGITYVKPEGAFYAMVDVSAFGVDGDTFAAKLLKEKHVAVIPGSGLGENCKDAVRISFAASEDTIRKATARMKEFIQEKAYES